MPATQKAMDGHPSPAIMVLRGADESPLVRVGLACAANAIRRSGAASSSASDAA